VIRGERVELKLKAVGPVPEGIQIPAVLEGARGARKKVMVTPGEPLVVDARFKVKSISWDPHRTVLCDVRTRSG
jgi:hypothetical protein